MKLSNTAFLMLACMHAVSIYGMQETAEQKEKNEAQGLISPAQQVYLAETIFNKSISSSLAIAPSNDENVTITDEELRLVMADKCWRRRLKIVNSAYIKQRLDIAKRVLAVDPEATAENIRDGVDEVIGKYVDKKANEIATELCVEPDWVFKASVRVEVKDVLRNDLGAYKKYVTKFPQKTIGQYLETECRVQ